MRTILFISALVPSPLPPYLKNPYTELHLLLLSSPSPSKKTHEDTSEEETLKMKLTLSLSQDFSPYSKPLSPSLSKETKRALRLTQKTPRPSPPPHPSLLSPSVPASALLIDTVSWLAECLSRPASDTGQGNRAVAAIVQAASWRSIGLPNPLLPCIQTSFLITPCLLEY